MAYFDELNLKIVDNKYIYPPVIILAVLFGVLFSFVDFHLAVVITLPLVVLYFSLLIFHTYRGIIKEIRYQDERNQALFNIYSLVKPTAPLPYLSGWAAFPELINTILGEVKTLKPDYIIEIGSGSSTIITSYLLQEHGQGFIHSLDHDEFYGGKTKAQLAQHGLSDYAEIHFTPLVDQSVGSNKYTWYDLSAFKLEENSVQLLVVDGPPEKTQRHARYPALPLLEKYLDKNAVVILDDAGRKEEQESVQMWLKEFPGFEHEFIPTEKGISILRRKA
ncbi:MAG: class I SAM-dependent methyltransferase [Balneola sp.]|nr:MAG: class I SAM-dependent methyltransferase [Balneola sp.]